MLSHLVNALADDLEIAEMSKLFGGNICQFWSVFDIMYYYFSVFQDCMFENKDWRKCQEHVDAFRKCMAEKAMEKMKKKK